MKRKTKQSGSGGRLRWALLLGAAAFLLVPIASASAATPVPVHIVISGSGSGKIFGIGEYSGGSTPAEAIDCEYNGATQSGVCDSTTTIGAEYNAISVEQEAEVGSYFLGGYEEGSELAVAGCEEGPPPIFWEYCSIIAFGGPITIYAVFEPEPKTPWPLEVTSSGEGSVECKVNGSTKPCTGGEVEEEKSVELIATPSVGYEPEWTSGPCAGGPEEHSETCSFAMPSEAVTANVEFPVASETLAVTEGGSGTGSVTCEVNGSPAFCNGTYSYGDEVKVEASPDPENIVESITGSGSAAGNCGAETCEFTLEAPTTVSVVFAPAGTKVEGEVPNTTSLTGCEAPVVLGPFVPTVAFNYENTCSLVATSTGNATELSAADLSGNETGHLVQGIYRLPSALKTKANGLAGLEFPGTGFPYASLDPGPVTLLTYGGPVSADNVTVHFQQHIGEHDALHTGTYSKPITLTLEQTAP
jgi:hypothetical protein